MNHLERSQIFLDYLRPSRIVNNLEPSQTISNHLVWFGFESILLKCVLNILEYIVDLSYFFSRHMSGFKSIIIWVWKVWSY